MSNQTVTWQQLGEFRNVDELLKFKLSIIMRKKGDLKNIQDF